MARAVHSFFQRNVVRRIEFGFNVKTVQERNIPTLYQTIQEIVSCGVGTLLKLLEHIVQHLLQDLGEHPFPFGKTQYDIFFFQGLIKSLLYNLEDLITDPRRLNLSEHSFFQVGIGV